LFDSISHREIYASYVYPRRDVWPHVVV
jgi:hypothetical protein